MHYIAAPARQAFRVGDDDFGAAHLRQLGGQGHGVGGTAEEIGPHAFALLRHLVGQQADRLSLFQAFGKDAHARHIGRRQHEVFARAGPFDQRFQGGALGRAVHHGQRRAQRDLLGDDFKAAQVRRQEDDAAAMLQRFFHQLPVFHRCMARHALGRRAPDER
ncbi:hypothetical protein D3C87_1324290 [compost metagenome]